MAFSGLKKQFNKANQFLNERVVGNEGTKLSESYLALEKRTDLTSGMVEDLQVKTKSFLQMNPSLFGQTSSKSLNPVGVLGDCMTTYGRKLENDNNLSRALEDTGEGLRKIADAKSTLDEDIKAYFLKPLNDVQHRELKDVEFHREKVLSRRLDFDSKKNKLESQQKSTKSSSSSAISEAEIKMAAGKFAESYKLAQLAMQKLMDKDLETVQHLSAFAESLQNYHSQCAAITKTLCETLEARKYIMDTGKSFTPETLKELDKYLEDGLPPYSTDTPPATPSRPPSLYSSNPFAPTPTPSCQALYDFITEASNDLQFRAGDTIQLIRRVDANWFEGSLYGRTGVFPASYVQVIVPLP